MDTAELVRAMRERESDALARFQTAYTPLIRYIISPILPDESDREECLSDVLLRAWESIGSYDPQKAAFSTWLAILARNAALNRRRDDARHQGHGALDDSIPDPAGTPEEALLRQERAKAIRAAVAELSPRNRELFCRKYYYYQSTAQIAAELGMTVRGVEGRLYRIRKQLQSRLGGERHD